LCHGLGKTPLFGFRLSSDHRLSAEELQLEIGPVRGKDENKGE
jgi:hypothetical protein